MITLQDRHQVRLKLVTAQIIPPIIAQVAQGQVQIQGLQEAQVQELAQVQDLAQELAQDQGMGRKQRPLPLNQQDRTLM